MTKNSGKNILIIDDDAIFLDFISSILMNDGFHIIPVNNYDDALEEYKKKYLGIELIVCDINIPTEKSLDFLEYNYKNAFIPLIICTNITEASFAIKALELGAHDYLLKPVEVNGFLNVVKNIINEKKRPSIKDGIEQELSGNLSTITIDSRSDELQKALRWLENKLDGIVDEKEATRYFTLLFEFVLNAHEHGNLGITEIEKSKMILEGRFNKVIEELEKKCDKKVKISVTIMENVVTVSISDEGKGFDHKKYMNFTREELMNKANITNGRGIFMGKSYFDSIRYSDGGSTVLLKKTL